MLEKLSKAMYWYRPTQTYDRFTTFNIPRRRIYPAFGLFIIISFGLLIHTNQQRLKGAFVNEGLRGSSGGVPGVQYDIVEEWQPPSDWDPVRPVWEDFPRNEQRFGSSIANLTNLHGQPIKASPRSYTPYPNFDSREYRNRYDGQYVSCVGPRGSRLNESLDDSVIGYAGFPNGFPPPHLGSSDMLGFDTQMCFDRYGRFGAYGLQSKDRSSRVASKPSSSVNWEDVNWGSLQRQCILDNENRFNMDPRPMPNDEDYEKLPPESHRYGPLRKQRTAVLFRSYDGFKYTTDAIRTMRSIIMELVLQSGGEYEAFLLVQVKDTKKPIFDDPKVYEQVVHNSVPKEFRNITVLWHEGLWGSLYPKIPSHARNVHVSQWLPIQWFTLSHPNFDFYWNWEMDIRYTGHHYQFAEQLSDWSTKQPRKGMWERNSRFYVPRFHGDFSTKFTKFVQSKYTSLGQSGEVQKDMTIWGPNPPPGQGETLFDDQPPLNSLTPISDNFTWGVGEEADLITFLPMFNPDTTHYALRNIYYNYPRALNPAGPPRRATIITLYRLSHRLLSTMHLENTRDPGHHMSSEVWPQSVALHHGFKAVYAPHSIYMDRDWPAEALDFIFNNGDSKRVIRAFKDVPKQGEGSGGWESVFGLDREHNFFSSTWYYRTMFSTRLYKRLLGYEVNGIGGKTWEAAHGRYCLPPILLHQIKDVEDPDVAEAIEKVKAAADGKAKAEADAVKAKEKAEEEEAIAQVEAITKAANADNIGKIPMKADINDEASQPRHTEKKSQTVKSQ